MKTTKLIITLLLILAAVCLTVFTKGLWALTGIVPAVAAFFVAYSLFSKIFGKPAKVLHVVKLETYNPLGHTRRVTHAWHPQGARVNPVFDGNGQPAVAEQPEPTTTPVQPKATAAPIKSIMMLMEVGDDTYFQLTDLPEIYFKDRQGVLWTVHKGSGDVMVRTKVKGVRQDFTVARTFTPGEARKAIASQA